MALIKLIFYRRRSRSPWKKAQAKPKRQGATPIHSVRRKFWLLGRDYSITLKPDAPRNSLKIDSEQQIFTVSLNPPTRENFDLYIDGWYRRRARKTFENAVDKWLPLLAEAGYPIPKPRLKIFDMRRAWGRCYYTKGLVTLNLHLIKTPEACIEYIILHELCHFVVHNHSKDFYSLLERFLPGWKETDNLLKQFARENRIIR